MSKLYERVKQNETDIAEIPVPADKQYEEGVDTGVDITSGVTGFSVTRGVFIPYQIGSVWRLRLNLRVSYTLTTSFSATFTLAGVVVPETQALATSSGGSGKLLDGLVLSGGLFIINSDGVQSHTGAMMSGDVELSSKPTWAL